MEESKKTESIIAHSRFKNLAEAREPSRQLREYNYFRVMRGHIPLASKLSEKRIRSIAKILSIKLHQIILDYTDRVSLSAIRKRVGLSLRLERRERLTPIQINKVILFCESRQHIPQPYTSEDWLKVKAMFQEVLLMMPQVESNIPKERVLPVGKTGVQAGLADMPEFTSLLNDLAQEIRKEIHNPKGRKKEILQKVFNLTSMILDLAQKPTMDFRLSPAKIKSRVRKYLKKISL